MTAEAPQPAVRTVLLLNAGQRDVFLDGAPLERTGLRERSDEIRNSLDEYRDRLTTEIVDKAITATVTPEGAPIDLLVIHGSDQSSSNPMHHGDTLHLASLVADLIRLRGDPRVRAAVAQHATGVDGVNDPDKMLHYFRNQFRHANAALARIRTDLSTPTRVVVSITGGTSGANIGLLLAAIEAFGDRVETIQPAETQTRTRIQVASTIRRQALLQPAVALLNEGQFATASLVIHEWRDARATPIALAADALQHWQDFAVTEAHQTISKATAHATSDPDLRSLLTDLERRLAPRAREASRSRREPTMNQLTDLLWTADLCQRQRRYVEFVARTARFNEAVLRREVCRRLGGIPTGDWRQNRVPFWTKVRDSLAPDGRAAINAGNPFGTMPINNPALTSVMDLLAKHGPGLAVNQPQITRVMDLVKIIDVAREMHNQSVAGHEFRGVTDAAIRAALGEIIATTDLVTHERLTHDGFGSVVLLEAMHELLGVIRMPQSATNPFLEYGRRLGDALVTLENA